MRYILALIGSYTLLCGCADKGHEGIVPYGLGCDYTENPVGLDNKSPRLSWKLKSGERAQVQTAWQILVSDSKEALMAGSGNKWNSGKVFSKNTTGIVYGGKKQESEKRYYWKVRSWDKRKKKTQWSKIGYWETGLLCPADWKAEWISFESKAAPLMRKEFEIRKTLREARVYISAPGYYELTINGSRIGDNVLDPGQTDYEQRVFYVVYDVTGELTPGMNAVGVMLGNGWYNQNVVNNARYGWKDAVYGIPGLIFQMHLRYSDGSDEYILSDKSWKGSPGPVISNNIYAGEQYDARLEQKGWDMPGFDDSGWLNVSLAAPPGGILVSQNIPPVKRMGILQPEKITSPKPGVYVFDMGQNLAGWAKIKLRAAKGTAIQLRFAECPGINGMIDPGSTGTYATGVVQTDRYICKGDTIETWEPRFTYHGFQYVEMTGFPGVPGKENLEGITVHTSLMKTGDFRCSDERFNRLHSTAIRTETGNLQGIPTDCPHRERCGWLGDAFLTSDMTMYNFNSAAFWTKFIRDIETSRRGDIPANIAPGRRTGGKDPDWGAAYIQLPLNMYLYYGDTTVINEHYAGMARFMDYLRNIARDFIVYEGIGSLFPPGRIMPDETPVEFTSTALFYFCGTAMSEMASVTGRANDSKNYIVLANEIKSAFNEKFYDSSVKTYGGQEKNVLALAFDLVPDGQDEAVAEKVDRDVAITHSYHMTEGIFGSRFICQVLGSYGYGETVRKMLDSDTYPGYGYLFSLGATTFWENWGELKFEDRDVRGDDRSKNHPFRGGFDAWFYSGLAGINPDPADPGFRHISVSPTVNRCARLRRCNLEFSQRSDLQQMA